MDGFADTRCNQYPGLKGIAYASSERLMLQNIGLILAGLAILIVGAQLLVKGASRLALALGIAPLIVGLTIVAFGTGAPELAVSIQSSLADRTNLLLGNAVGSNIYNVLFILGVCATITPLAVAPQLIRLDVPIMVGAALTLLLMAQDGVLNRLDGAILIGALVAYTLFVIVQSRKEKTGVKNDYAEQIDEAIHPDRRFWLHGLFILVGLALLGLGSDLLIGGAVAIAQALGVAEVIIGMTVVTIGTTAPELSACLVAAWKGERDIAVGNIVGSNLFNILAVLGVGAVVAPQGIEVGPRMLSFGIPVMTIVLFACLPVFFAGQAIRRWEGVMFLSFFAIYLANLVLEEIQDERVLTLQNAVVWFIAPLAIVTVAVSAWREFRKPMTALPKGSGK
jgi:cation:H+ antiporter